VTVRPEYAQFVALIMEATEEEMVCFDKAIMLRRKFLREMRREEATHAAYVGSYVELTDCSPGYLNGCKGRIESIGESGAYVLFIDDIEASTSQKRASNILCTSVHAQPRNVKVLFH
jgi:hypothetical protein